MVKIAIGAAQFGMAYGLNNRLGVVGEQEIRAILKIANENDIRFLDTAVVYGESESTLGKIGVENFNLITKIPQPSHRVSDLNGWFEKEVESSLLRLGLDSLYGLLLHSSNSLLGENRHQIAASVEKLKNRGLFRKVGVSIYEPSELEYATKVLAVDLVQAPFNILDRRLVSTGWLHRLNDLGVEVHTRSVFLQGLLLMPPDSRPPFFSKWRRLFDRWDAWLEETETTPVAACLGFALSEPIIDRVVVGTDSLAQFEEILAAAEVPVSMPPANLRSEDPDLINPSRWQLS